MHKKKIIAAILLAILLAVLGMAAVFMIGPQGIEWGKTDRFQSGQWSGYMNRMHNKCYLIGWEWDGDENNMELTIPEEIDGMRVVGLGGFEFGYAMVFDIVMPEEYQVPNLYDVAWVTGVDSIAAEYPQDFPTYRFKVHLNSRITNTGDCEDNLYCSTTDGQSIAYKIEMEFVTKN